MVMNIWIQRGLRNDSAGSYWKVSSEFPQMLSRWARAKVGRLNLSLWKSSGRTYFSFGYIQLCNVFHYILCYYLDVVSKIWSKIYHKLISPINLKKLTKWERLVSWGWSHLQPCLVSVKKKNPDILSWILKIIHFFLSWKTVARLLRSTAWVNCLTW